MLRRTVLISLMAALPLAAQANATVINLASSSCSGAMSISSLAGASLSCAGNLSLNGGLIDSDSRIFIRADGDLFLQNLQLTAPEISFSTVTGNIQIASSVNIQTVPNTNNAGGQIVIHPLPGKQIIDWKPFDITLNPGGNINFNMPPSNNGALEKVLSGGEVVINADSIKITSAVINAQASVTAVPEANTGAMLLLGFGLLALRRKP